MKRHLVGMSVAVAVLATSFVGWEALAGRLMASPTIVGTVDLPRVLESLEEWQAEVDRSQVAADQFQENLKQRSTELEALDADLEDFVVGTPKYIDAQRVVKKAAIDLRAFMSLADMREARTKQRAMLRIYNHIRDASGSLSKQDGYGLILMNDSAIPIPEDSRDVLGDISARRVLFASNTIDVTQPLIDFMNTQWRAAHGN
ncbi:MAG: OmpH family outer membrane protein [Phycisphaerae bacterium]|jgi:Skp family chaperone for outer membrane proteins|nr:OmpH family outer membrane protein [Phycisphaerae bacterium]MBT5382011.1 OmpH family outer membrane protein [Phycisphaerae bacterium]MBT5657058.1 OmpH family outer membrane protein [Phycisphaerae bacterium]MBT7350859.1 OmpH family outer membrane protein [Phycisphaerae bacterium]